MVANPNRANADFKGPIGFLFLIGFIAYFIVTIGFSDNPSDNLSAGNVTRLGWPVFDHSNISYVFYFDNMPDYVSNETKKWEDYFYYYEQEYPEFNKSKAKEKIKNALNLISEGSSRKINFREVNGTEYFKPDIIFISALSTEDPDCQSDSEGYFTMGVGIPEVDSRGYIISSTIKFCVPQPEWGVSTFHYFWPNYDCKASSLEVHEILHGFGFGHTFDELEPLLHPVSDGRSCRENILSERIKKCLGSIYDENPEKVDCSGFKTTLDRQPENLGEEDFKWDTLPLRIAYNNCSVVQVNNLRYGISLLEKFTNKTLFLEVPLTNAQVSFYCEQDPSKVPTWENYSFYTDKFSKGGYAAALPEYFRDESESSMKIKSMKITLYPLPEYANSKCGGIEMHELLHALGLREHTGIWMNKDVPLCSGGKSVVVIDKDSLKRLDELYKNY